MTRLLGLDHGSRRIGVAVGETETGMAFARAALRVRSAAAAVEAIRRLADDEGTTLVVVGLPTNMDGTEGVQAAAVRAFGDRLGRTGLQIVYQDERLSSWQATEQMARSGRRPPRAGGELDSEAALLILQEYLDARRSPGRLEETE